MEYKTFALEDIASKHVIDRSDEKMNADLLRATLAAVRPDMMVDDGEGPVTMMQLAKQHGDSDRTMSEEDAWKWANHDLVFGGFRPVSVIELAEATPRETVRRENFTPGEWAFLDHDLARFERLYGARECNDVVDDSIGAKIAIREAYQRALPFLHDLEREADRERAAEREF